MKEDTIQITKKEAHIISRCLWYFNNETDIMSARLSLNAHKEKGNKYEVDGFKRIIKLYQEQDKTHKIMTKKIEVFLHGEEDEE
jgi:ribosomal protein S10